MRYAVDGKVNPSRAPGLCGANHAVLADPFSLGLGHGLLRCVMTAERDPEARRLGRAPAKDLNVSLISPQDNCGGRPILKIVFSIVLLAGLAGNQSGLAPICCP